MKVPRQCHGSVMAVSWQTAMTLPWHCHDTVVALSSPVVSCHLRNLPMFRLLSQVCALTPLHVHLHRVTRYTFA